MPVYSTILIVDDDQSILNSLKRLFIDDPITIHAVDNPDKALPLLNKYPIELVLSDEKMPGMSGVEFLKYVRAHRPDIIRILLTGNPQIETVIKAVNEGEVYRFLTKPWDPKKLRALILETLRQEHLKKESSALPEETKQKRLAVDRLEKKYPGITDVKRDDKGIVVIPDPEDG